MGAKVSVKIRAMAEKGDAEGLKKMVSKSSKITAEVLDSPGSDGSTAFLLAAKNNHADVVKLLLEHGCNPYCKDMCEESGVTYAATEGHINCLATMKESGKVDFNHNPLPLIAVTQAGNVDMAKWLIENGADPSQLSDTGEGALVHAVVKKNYDLMKLFIDNKVNLDTGTIVPHARFPLQAAVSRLYMDKKAMIMLVDAGANINLADAEEQWTVLHQAVSDGSVRVIGYLMENGADPTLKNKNGKTPHDIANEMFDEKNIIHAQLSGEVVDMRQETKVWESVNQQEGGFGDGGQAGEHFA
eukprot:CAMPEP_0201522966 /NCGR_PEP_ID=MMETSP0161_2-20130828/18667_1 /ASSEMBLY_ACC=CAM_ASM_000251 /TAXON_ID=180227 /ORGANISM="Neoparamoeba aestuarina, Strain SoJaBio B1-5/56/2" /LENGTH=299 /DNA_ID=CAMNT_0047921949 /DNA_START=93 /DNA_END=992 /DNA_ORIENTATION=-